AVGDHVNLFAGMLKNARSGDSYYAVSRNQDGRKYRILINHNAKEGRETCFSFPMATFEPAVLNLLKELDPHAILNGDATPDETVGLKAELARVESRIEALERELQRGDVAALARALRTLEAQQRDLADQLADARQRAAHPLSETWGEAKGLFEELAEAADP